MTGQYQKQLDYRDPILQEMIENEGDGSVEESYFYMDNNDLDLVAHDYEEYKRSTTDGPSQNMSS